MVDFTLPLTTNEIISISTSQTFRSRIVILHLLRPMTFLYLSWNDTTGLAPRMNVLFWGPGDIPVSYLNIDSSWNAWNRHSGSFMVDTGILFSNMKSPSRMFNDILTLTSYSDIPTDQTFHQFHDHNIELDFHRYTSGPHGAFATGVACQQGMLTPPDTLFRPLLGACIISWLLRPVFPNLRR